MVNQSIASIDQAESRKTCTHFIVVTLIALIFALVIAFFELEQDYMFGVEPINGKDTPQMTTIINNLKQPAP